MQAPSPHLTKLSNLEGRDLLPQNEQMLDVEQLPVDERLLARDELRGRLNGDHASRERLLGQTLEDLALEAPVQLGQADKGSPDSRVPHPVEVGRRI